MFYKLLLDVLDHHTGNTTLAITLIGLIIILVSRLLPAPRARKDVNFPHHPDTCTATHCLDLRHLAVFRKDWEEIVQPLPNVALALSTHFLKFAAHDFSMVIHSDLGNRDCVIWHHDYLTAELKVVIAQLGKIGVEVGAGVNRCATDLTARFHC